MSRIRTIIPAAGQGSRLSPLTDNQPKCMVPLHGRPLLHWQLNAIRSAGVSDIVVVGGYKIDKLSAPGCRVLVNPEFETTNMVQSLWCAEEWFDDGFIMAYGDIIYNSEIYSRLLESSYEIAVVVDRSWRSYWELRTSDVLNDAESLKIANDGRIESIGQKVADINLIEGQYIGLVAFRRNGLREAKRLVEQERKANEKGQNLICQKRSLRRLYMTDLLQGLINEGIEVRPVWIEGGWLEIDTMNDLSLAETLTRVGNDAILINR